MKRFVRRHWLALRIVCIAVAAAGLLLMIGTAGASDLDRVSNWQIVLQSLAGVLMFAGGAKLGGLFW